MKPQTDTRVVTIGNEVMILSGLHDEDIARDEGVAHAIDFKDSLALKNDESFLFVLMDVNIRPSRAVVIVGPFSRFFESQSSLAKEFSGETALEKMPRLMIFQFCQSKVFHLVHLSAGSGGSTSFRVELDDCVEVVPAAGNADADSPAVLF